MTTLDNVIGFTRGTMLEDVNYDPRHEAAFGTLEKLKRLAKKTGVAKPGEVEPWLKQQGAYTLHRQVRKRFPRKPYSVDNIMDVWECDFVDVQALSRHNAGVKYLLTVIDVFSKFLHMFPLKSKSGRRQCCFSIRAKGPPISEAFQETLSLGSNRQGERIPQRVISKVAETRGHTVAGL